MDVSGPDFDNDFHHIDFEVLLDAVKVVNLQAQGLTIGSQVFVSIALQAQDLTVDGAAGGSQ